MKNKLIKNSIYYIIGGILIQGINFFTLPIFIKILSVEDFGKVSIYLTYVGIMTIILSMQIHGSIGNFFISYEKKGHRSYYKTMITFLIFSLLIWLLLTNLFGNWLSNIFNFNKTILIFIAINSFFSSIINFETTDLIFMENPKKKLILSFGVIFLNILISIVFITKILKNDLYLGRIYGSIFGVGLISLIIIIKTYFLNKEKIDFDYLKFALPITLPLIFHNLSHVVLSSSDKIMIEHYTTFENAGIYNFGVTLGFIINILFQSVNNAWVPWFYDKVKNGKKNIIEEYSLVYLRGFSLITIIFLLVLPEIVRLFTKKTEYRSSLEFLPLIVLGCFFIFLYSFPVNYEFYHKKTKIIAFSTFLSAALNIGLNLYFIPKYGIIGAATTTTISYFSIFLFHEIILRKMFKYAMITVKNYVFQIMLVCFSIFIYFKYINNYIVRYIYILFLLITHLHYFYKVYKMKGGNEKNV